VPIPLRTPREGLPPVTASTSALTQVIDAFAAAGGPIAIDAERASGYRYGQRAYLIQLRRAGAGTALVDPIACPDLSALNAALADCEWILHAATQDLPCLAETGLSPTRLFDTELAGRLAGFARVGLGPLVQALLGLSLEKAHAAVDWSRRPLPEAWLRYAALDVEVLIELRNALETELRRQGKLDWARQEFAAIVATPLPGPVADPWRRTSGLHQIRTRRQLAIVRALWQTRDQLARKRDIYPGRILADAAIVATALTAPATVHELAELAPFNDRSFRPGPRVWFASMTTALALDEEALPPLAPAYGQPPPARIWGKLNPAASERLGVARATVAAIAAEHTVPAENLLAPHALRRLSWQPPSVLSDQAVVQALRDYGARPWQIQLTAAAITRELQSLALRTKNSST